MRTDNSPCLITGLPGQVGVDRGWARYAFPPVIYWMRSGNSPCLIGAADQVGVGRGWARFAFPPVIVMTVPVQGCWLALSWQGPKLWFLPSCGTGLPAA